MSECVDTILLHELLYGLDYSSDEPPIPPADIRELTQRLQTCPDEAIADLEAYRPSPLASTAVVQDTSRAPFAYSASDFSIKCTDDRALLSEKFTEDTAVRMSRPLPFD